MRPSLEHLDQLVEPLNAAEQVVLDALATLDDDWTVYIQPRIGLDNPDFIVVHRLAGVCAIEVKNWKPGMYRRTADGFVESTSADETQRLQGGQPRHQASRYRTTIYDQFFALPSDAAMTTEAVRSVVVLPNFSDTEAFQLLSDPTVSEAEGKVAVWGRDGLTEHLDRLVRGNGCAHPRPESLDRLAAHLIPSEIAAPAPAAKMNADVEHVARNPENDQVRRVRGPAGSGKSLALTARAARLAQQGKKVLVLSFSATFANRLRSLVDERCREFAANPTLVTCANFHSFCERTVQDAQQHRIEMRAPKGARWTRAIVAKARAAFEAGFENRYDAVLVDEGQDFALDWWNLLREHVVVPDGEMLLVVDPTQDLYDKNSWADDGLMLDAGFYTPWTELSGSYRMPRDMMTLANDFAAAYLDGERLEAEVLDDHSDIVGPESGSIRRWINIDNVGDVGRAVGREVVRLLQENPNLAPRDVAFLCEYHHDGVAAVNEIEAAGYDVHHIFSRNPDDPRRQRKYRFWPGAAGIKGCTVHNFKGWELPALVMGIGVEARSNRIAYVAMTRLKARPDGGPSYLSVVNADKSIAGFQSTFESSAASMALAAAATTTAAANVGLSAPNAELPPQFAPPSAALPAPTPAVAPASTVLADGRFAPPVVTPPVVTPPDGSPTAPVAPSPTGSALPPPTPAPPTPGPTWGAPAAADRLG